MKLLQLLPSLDPQQGGTTECVRQMSRRLAALGHHVELVTLDPQDAPWLRDAGAAVHALGPSRGGYRYAPRLLPWLRANAARFDAVIVNGLWQYHGFAAWMALRGSGVPYYVFPHGMLDPWFRTQHPLKHLKKWLYWPWAEYRVLRDARTVMFTAEEERLRARESFWLYRVREAVVNFGTAWPPLDDGRLREAFLAACPELRGKRLLLFLGRIHPKKGCDLLIEAFARVAGTDPFLHLVMAGPDGHGAAQWGPSLRARAEALGVGARVSWPGMLRDDMKWGAFHASDAFVLPSHQENFGIAVAEALGCGVPALVSTRVNIWRELVRNGAGMTAIDTVDGTESMLRRWLATEPAEREGMRVRARVAFARHFTVEAMAADVLRVVQGGPVPFAGSGPATAAGLHLQSLGKRER
ncbi:glycosyltransferase [Cupriavidus sp. WKF15]|uniref:glycosyltransferase n=1 Tax=Cupriavidus sp. WKF15 TaxID=3032282 RepID=UPI0023E1F760|nr:glycosyltransferase [Cupriavidus sp. WKF15]WER48966.1 glycosyltransferase [Cupriavidus sp. WKF15]